MTRKDIANKKRKRVKSLTLTLDEFFVLCELMVGKPDPAAKTYTSTRQYANPRFCTGTSHYLREHPTGIAFTHCVTAAGEAKCRAGKLYWLYVAHWRDREKRERDADGGAHAGQAA